MTTNPVSQAPAAADQEYLWRKAGRIEVTGEIALGRPLKLLQLPTGAHSGGEDGPGVANWMGNRIEYELAPAFGEKDTAIRNHGLVTGYGIFGAPGTGKSHMVLQILERMLKLNQDRPDVKFGGLILDPKAALLDSVTKLWSRLGEGRRNDLVILKPDLLNEPEYLRRYGVDPDTHIRSVNIIDCALSPGELGRMLVLAAQSAGVAAKEPFWFLAWTNLFGAALTLLEYHDRYVPTVRRLLNAILLPGRIQRPRTAASRNGGSAGRSVRGIEEIAELMTKDVKETARVLHEQIPALPAAQIETDISAAAAQIESFFASDYVRTLEAFITNAFGPFQQHRFWCLSPEDAARPLVRKYGRGKSAPGFYDLMIEQGKVVLVSVGPEDPGMGKMLCTLVKTMFQQTVMSRRERFLSFKLENFRRPVFLACDEYAEIASEVPGQPVGDGRFFSLARENGCMGVLATQSIHTLENSALKESWKSIFSNLGAKIFMGAADNETAKQASDLAGTVDWEMSSTSVSHSREQSFSRQDSFQQRPELSPYILTHVLKQGQAVAIGSLDGRATPPALRFFQVPESAADLTSPESKPVVMKSVRKRG
jgi:TraM recognition site of TraD and TraG